MNRIDITEITHHVIYSLNGGSGVVPIQGDVQEDEKFTAASYSGTRATFSFGGWNDGTTTYQPGTEITMGEDDITLTAVWNPVKHKVTYSLNGGSGEAPSQTDVQEGQKFTVSMYSGTKAGYSFGGWSYGGVTYHAGQQITMGGSNITLTAVWDPLPIIIFDANGGTCTVTEMRTGTDGKLSSLPAPTYRYHDFDGWFTSSSGGDHVTEATVFDRNATVYAHWSACTVTYDHGMLVEATGDPDSVGGLDTGMEISEGATYQKLPDTAGYRHTGWEVDGRTVGPTASVIIETSHTARSVWTEITTFIIIPDDPIEPEIPVVIDRTGSERGSDSSSSAVVVATGCVIALLAILVLTFNSRFKS